jgi:ankyrin repeat protein
MTAETKPPAKRFPLIGGLSILLVLVLTAAGAYYVRKLALENALVSAMKVGDGDTVLKLSRSWPSPYRAMAKGCRSPVHWAARYGSRELVEFLLDRGLPADGKAPKAQDDTAFVRFRNRGMCLSDLTPLEVAVISGKADVAALLISRGADAYRQGFSSSLADTLLDMAVASRDADTIAVTLRAVGRRIGPDDLVWDILTVRGPFSPRALDALFAGYGSLDRADPRGQTALFYAIIRRLDGVAEILLSHGADPNCPRTSGISPLSLALFLGNERMIEVLRKHGAKE